MSERPPDWSEEHPTRFDDSDEAIYDAYLDEALEHGPPDLDAFCQRHSVSPELRERIAALQEELASGGDDTRATRPPAEPGLPFERLGDFALLRPLGSGGSSRVFLAWQESLGRHVALKVARGEQASTEAALARFRAEAEATGRLDHPGLARVYEIGQDQSVAYLALEHVPGRSLEEIIAEARAARRPLPVRRVIEWMVCVARALEHVHSAGVVHRDVKPANIRITPDDQPVLVDFGIAGGEASSKGAGTLPYAAPERLAQEEPEAALPSVDLWALGVTLYEALTLERPFSGASPERMRRAILAQDPRPPCRRRSSIPRDLQTVVLAALEKDPARRYPTMQRLAEDLEAILELRPISIRSPGLVTRGRRWARRHRVAVSLGALVLAGVLVSLVLEIGRSLEERARVRRRVAGELTKAQDHLEAYRQAHRELDSRAERQEKLRRAVSQRRLSSEEIRELQSGAGSLERLRSEVVRHRLGAREALARVGSLEPSALAAVTIETELLLEEWRRALADRAPYRAAILRDRIGETLTDDQRIADIEPQGTVTIRTGEPDAEVHLFRYREQGEVVEGGDRRLVPVPVGGEEWTVEPGRVVLRVVRGAGEVESGALILEVAGHPIEGSILVLEGNDEIPAFDRLVRIDSKPMRSMADVAELSVASGLHRFVFEGESGEKVVEASDAGSLEIRLGDVRDLVEQRPAPIPARVFQDGNIDRVLLPEGLEARKTAAALPLSSVTRIGTTPLPELELPIGSYLALLRREGSDDRRLPFVVREGEPLELAVELRPAGSGPAGFVYVPGGRFVEGGDPRAYGAPEEQHPVVEGFWIMEREVTWGEWAAFVDEAGDDLEGTARDARSRAFWQRMRLRDGRVVPESRAAEAAFGMSYREAEAYARWRTERARREDEPWTFDLPTGAEWEKASRGVDGRWFAFGNRFVPAWTKSAWSRPGRNRYERVQSYPIDESVHGAFDLVGNLSEYCRPAAGGDPTTEGLVLDRGGSLISALPEAFRAAYRPPPIEATSTSPTRGFRLVAR